MDISLRLHTGEEVKAKVLFPPENEQIDSYNIISLDGSITYLKLKLIENNLEIEYTDSSISEDENILKNKLEELLLLITPQNASLGTEDNEISDENADPYDPEKIRVDTKSFSLRQIFDMMKQGDIDLNPDFQRNLVWDSARKSRLIESILLRIPLPMFYFSQDDEGKISVVDGLQRLSTIRDFMDNKFKLQKLEYLEDNCKDKFYKVEDPNQSIDTKYFRWFNMTQITVNVIDPSSPFKLKYDIFRRINTGGQPLNAQEIRNCLASDNLRETLKAMVKNISFWKATGRSIKGVRMEDQELALRFILFYKKHKADNSLNNYSGNIESELNALTEELSKDKKGDLSQYVKLFENAMKNAYHLFGDYCFRKCLVQHIDSDAKRQLINKALFVSWSVLLSDFNHAELKNNHKYESFAYPQAKMISENGELFRYLTYSTNSKSNVQASFEAAKALLFIQEFN